LGEPGHAKARPHRSRSEPKRTHHVPIAIQKAVPITADAVPIWS